jgi:hypothetical protein
MAEATVAGGGLDRRRWVLLWVIGLAQLMVVLDLTVLNIALPSAQRALGFSTSPPPSPPTSRRISPRPG